MSKPRLIVLSDIFGTSDDSWMAEYRNKLNNYFEVIEYDSRVLAEVSIDNQENVHSQFVNGGIDKAVENLVRLESNESAILGFSVGGTIAWKTALRSENIKSLYLVSATRLRDETVKPTSSIHLYFGEFEKNGPMHGWFDNLKISPVILAEGNHDCYRDSSVVARVCESIISSIFKHKT